MATDPRLAPDKGQEPVTSLEKEAKQRLQDAREQKTQFQVDIEEAYFFTAPRRVSSVSSDTVTTQTRPQSDVLQTAIGAEEAENFATTLINSFMPQGQPWVDLKPAADVPEEFRQQVEQELAAQRDKVFELIDQSNFYEQLACALNPDASIGTFALWIEPGRMLHEPIQVHAVPLRELEINVGPDGYVDDRFRVLTVKNRHVKGMIPEGSELPAAMAKKIADKPNEKSKLAIGFWRDWSVKGDVVWKHVVLVNDKKVFDTEARGWGSNPLLVATFNRHPEWAYGEGPAIKALPELRQFDDIRGAVIEYVDMTLRPPIGWPDDSMGQFKDGIQPGAAYSVRPGTEGAIKPIYEPQRIDGVFFDLTQREHTIRKLFYNDFPEQRGDTPPTATQWVDEMAMAQRKIGTPGLKFWREGPMEIFQRFYRIAMDLGYIEEIKLPDSSKTVAVAPYNPTQRAQDQQKVAMFVRAAQIGASVFPEEMKVRYDGAKTLDQVFGLMDVSKLFVKRSEQDIQQAVGQLAQLSGSASGSFAPTQTAPVG